MQSFFTAPTSFKNISLAAFRHWWSSLKLTWPLIILLVILREYYCSSCQGIHPQHPIWNLVVTLLLILIDISLWVAICAAIYRSFEGRTEGLWVHFLELLERSPLLLLAAFLYSFFVSLAGLGGYGLGWLVLHHVAADSPFLKMLPVLIGFPMIFVAVLLLFVLPLFVIDKLSFWGAFKKGAGITYHHWFRAFCAYAAVIIFIFAIRFLYMMQGQWEGFAFLDTGINLISFLVLVPLVANFYVLVMHDLKLRALNEAVD